MSAGLLWCADEERRAILSNPAHPLNGIDFVEYVRAPLAPPGQRHRLDVRFLKAPPAGLAADPAAFRVEGGIRVTGVRVLAVAAAGATGISVFLDREGDFSRYLLVVAHPALDPERSEEGFSFKVGCPTELDCKAADPCEPLAPLEPALDYLAKDYQSFRRLMLDLAREIDPGFTETNAADLTITIIELFASVGDFLSYHQDAAATEAFFDTCRSRISAARHARLIDQVLHEGRNAHGFVAFDAAPGGDGVVLAGVKLGTRIGAPLAGAAGPPGLIIPETADFDADPALLGATVFETSAPTRVIAARNRLRVHDFGDMACCLGAGATEAFLYATAAAGADLVASRPDLLPGEFLLLEEVLGTITGLAADADPRQRHAVRIEAVEAAEDPLFRDRLVGGTLTPRSAAAQASLLLLKVRWQAADALPMPLCLSVRLGGAEVRGVTIARGNVAPADHGRTVIRRFPPAVPGGPGLPTFEPGSGRWPIDIQRLEGGPQPPGMQTAGQVSRGPMPEAVVLAPDGRLAVGRHALAGPPEMARAQIILSLTGADGAVHRYLPVPSLLDSGPDDRHMVVERDEASGVQLRFGDGVHGRRPGRPVAAEARLRLGNGRAGNIGHGALVHVVMPTAAERVDPANPAGPPLPFPQLVALHQPLAMKDGVEPQPIAELKALAPAAMRAENFRAVTLADWREKAEALAGVEAAQARFVWTGSWLTVMVAVHPEDPAMLLRLPGGGAMLAPAFAATIAARLSRFRVVGHDLVVRAARYVPVALHARLCVAAGHFRGDVLKAAGDALSNRRLAGGGTGLFHSSRQRFGGPVYLSHVHAALLAVPGVESAEVLVFRRYWDVANGELERGVIAMGPDEIARLDASPSAPEFGELRLSAVGGL
jgi:hypothetical protein